MHLLAIHNVNRIVHILYEHLIRGTSRMGANKCFWLGGTITFLSVVHPLLVLTLVPINGILPFFRNTNNRFC